jgi:hypothetical protein
MVRIFAGYTIEQDELVRLLQALGWGPEPGEPELTVADAWMNFFSWRCTKPRRGDLNTLLPWVQCEGFLPSRERADAQFPIQTGMIRMEITSMPS